MIVRHSVQAQSLRERNVTFVMQGDGPAPLGVYWSWRDSALVVLATAGGTVGSWVLLSFLAEVLK